MLNNIRKSSLLALVLLGLSAGAFPVRGAQVDAARPIGRMARIRLVISRR
jgi:hypothetical protein